RLPNSRRRGPRLSRSAAAPPSSGRAVPSRRRRRRGSARAIAARGPPRPPTPTPTRSRVIAGDEASLAPVKDPDRQVPNLPPRSPKARIGKGKTCRHELPNRISADDPADHQGGAAAGRVGGEILGPPGVGGEPGAEDDEVAGPDVDAHDPVAVFHVEV